MGDRRTESQILAKEIYDIENADVETKSEWIRDNVLHWHLSSNIRLEMSTDRLMWYLFKSAPDGLHYLFKAVPMTQYSAGAIYLILKAQTWKRL